MDEVEFSKKYAWRCCVEPQSCELACQTRTWNIVRWKHEPVKEIVTYIGMVVSVQAIVMPPMVKKQSRTP